MKQLTFIAISAGILGLLGAGCGPVDGKLPMYPNAEISTTENAQQTNMMDRMPRGVRTDRQAAEQDQGDNKVLRVQEGKLSADEIAKLEGAGVRVIIVPNGGITPKQVAVIKDIVKTIQLPTLNRRLPTKVRRSPTVTIPEASEVNYIRVINHLRDIVKVQPILTHHHTNKNIHKQHKYYTRIINKPVYSNRYTQSTSVSESHEVMPTTEVTLPATGSYSAYPAYYGTGYNYYGRYLAYCHPFYRGKFWRYCQGRGY